MWLDIYSTGQIFFINKDSQSNVSLTRVNLTKGVIMAWGASILFKFQSLFTPHCSQKVAAAIIPQRLFMKILECHPYICILNIPYKSCHISLLQSLYPERRKNFVSSHLKNSHVAPNCSSPVSFHHFQVASDWSVSCETTGRI